MGPSLEVGSSSYPQPSARQNCAPADPGLLHPCSGLVFEPALAKPDAVGRRAGIH